MNSKTNYMLVGIFVLLSLALILFFVMWLMRPTDEIQMRLYRINFMESVSGLNIDSPVKYRGVSIGKVKKMQINPRNNELIEVLIEVVKTAPVKTDTVAKLKAQGITGLSFVDLSEGSKESPLLLGQNNDEILEIKSAPSFLVRVEQTFGTVSQSLTKTMQRTQKLLSDENQKEFSLLLKRLSSTVERAESLLSEKLVKDFHRLIASSADAAKKINYLIPKIGDLVEKSKRFEEDLNVSMTSISHSFKLMGDSAELIRQRNAVGDYSVKENVGAPMKQFELTMREMQTTMIRLNSILDRFGESPSNLIFMNEEKNIGPGERK